LYFFERYERQRREKIPCPTYYYCLITFLLKMKQGILGEVSAIIMIAVGILAFAFFLIQKH
jgi:hypothetical protein